jgi:hypothetical protein
MPFHLAARLTSLAVAPASFVRQSELFVAQRADGIEIGDSVFTATAAHPI